MAGESRPIAISASAGNTKARNWTRSPDRDLSFEVSSRMIATTPKNRAMQMNICTNFSVEDMNPPLLSGGTPPGRHWAGRAGARELSRRSGRRPGLLDVVEGVLRALAGDPGGHLLPEGVGAHLTRHLVRTVETEDRVGVLEDLRGELVDRADQVGHVQPRVRADPAATRGGLGLLVGPDVGRQVGLERLDLGVVGERGHELATAEDRLAELVAHGRQVEREHVAVFGHLGALRPVGGVEPGLAVQCALAVED